VESPEHPHQHPAHTGHRWLDIILALSAMFVSVISLFIAIEHGRTMERMAEANARMVQANSWPFVEFSTHNVDEHGNGDVRLVLTNEGIGPARIETLELWWNGQPMSSAGALLDACCSSTNPTERAREKTTVTSWEPASPKILRAGEEVDFFSMPFTPRDKELWDKFSDEEERGKITARICFCSVFNECWLGSGRTTHADPVASCPVPKVPYQSPPPN
jgi:hypothetical protein